nr:hypothetical protein [Klebsiella pneumoniae]UVD62755.1 hypothetical protein [Klebsiella pneumoniae]UVN19707.1 hypothetical protein [Klebsiella michiganensis]
MLCLSQLAGLPDIVIGRSAPGQAAPVAPLRHSVKLRHGGGPECGLPPAEFFFLLFYTLHNGEVVLENVISHIKPISAFRS